MRKTTALLLGLLTSGCNMVERMSTVGSGPQLSHIQDPTTLKNYQPVNMPMPESQPTPNHSQCGSLWLNGSKAFFKDQRAKSKGDIVMVDLVMDQKQSMAMSPKINRQATGSEMITSALGYERKFEKFFPKKQRTPTQKNGDTANSTWMDTTSNPQLSGTAQYDITDKMKFSIACTVIQVLPNGNMVVEGRQEVKLVNEVREITLKGIVRREDISGNNTISSTKIAELRVYYGGRGDLSDMQEFPWGHQIINKLNPF